MTQVSPKMTEYRKTRLEKLKNDGEGSQLTLSTRGSTVYPGRTESVMDRVGSFLGMSDDPDNIKEWKERFVQNVKSRSRTTSVPGRKETAMRCLQDASSQATLALGNIYADLQEDTTPRNSRQNVGEDSLSTDEDSDSEEVLTVSSPEDQSGMAYGRGDEEEDEEAMDEMLFGCGATEFKRDKTPRRTGVHFAQTASDGKNLSRYKDYIAGEHATERAESPGGNLSHTISEPEIRVRQRSMRTGGAAVAFAPVVSVTEFYNVDEKGGLLKQLRSKKMKASDGAPPSGSASMTTNTAPSKSILKQPATSIHTLYENTDSEPEETYVYRAEAFAQYQQYVEMETRQRCRELYLKKQHAVQELLEQQEHLEEALEMARGYYCEPSGSLADSWRRKVKEMKEWRPRGHKGMSRVDIRGQLEELHEFFPFFILIISMIHIIVFIVQCMLSPIAPIALQPKVELRPGIKTFLGTETIDHWILPNIWIGAFPQRLIQLGALFAPCMRNDYQINLLYTQQGFSAARPLGCCEVAVRNTAGTTTETECQELSNGVGFWRSGVTCEERTVGQTYVAHILRPCCVGFMGQCRLITHEHCVFLKGTFHQDGAEHCRQVNCLSETCGMGGLVADPDYPYKPQSANQWWRLPLSLFYHHGVLHLLLVLAIQLYLGTRIEALAGWLRMALIYLISGIMGLLAGAVFNPYIPHVGAGGASFGLLGVVLIELFQAWKIVKHPVLELLKIMCITTLLLLSGTVPYVDNTTHIAGFLLGVLGGVIFLPYITFGRWDGAWKKVIIVIAVPCALFFVFMLFQGFYKVQYLEACSSCKYFNCVPYTDLMCKISKLI